MEDEKRERRETVALKVEYTGAPDLVADYTQNISRGGTFVRTSRSLEKGVLIELTLSFPGLIQPLALTGVVRWVRRGPPDECGVGIQFDNLDATALARLDRLVIKIAGGHPDVIKGKFHVLVVENNPRVAKVIQEGLAGDAIRELSTSVNFKFTSVDNGRDALAALDKDAVDFLIIDVHFPMFDGVSLIQRVRTSKKLKYMPIVAVSACDTGEREREEALKAGADFFLHKPSRLAEIVSTVRRFSGL